MNRPRMPSSRLWTFASRPPISIVIVSRMASFFSLMVASSAPDASPRPKVFWKRIALPSTL
jgi:hypothetical protein